MGLRCVRCWKRSDEPKFDLCPDCREKRRATRLEQEAAGLCNQYGCSSPTDGGTKQCAHHREYHRQKNKERRARNREGRREAERGKGERGRPLSELLQDYDAIL